MSFYHPKDFATNFNLKYSTVRSHISRKKLIKNKEGYIDMSHPTNQMYVTENRLSSEGNVAAPPAPPRVKKSEIEHSSENIPRNSEPDVTSGGLTSLMLREKKAKTLKVEREAQYKALQIQKMQGELMPIELVERTQTINIQSIFRSFESGLENIASIYNERLGGDRASLAEITTRMRETLHRSIKSAEEKSKEEIKGLMAEYAATRSRGEKK